MTTEERIQQFIDADADRHRAGAPEYRSGGMVSAEGPVVHGTEISQETTRPIAPDDTTTPGSWGGLPVLSSYLVLEDSVAEIFVAKCDVVAGITDLI